MSSSTTDGPPGGISSATHFCIRRILSRRVERLISPASQLSSTLSPTFNPRLSRNSAGMTIRPPAPILVCTVGVGVGVGVGVAVILGAVAVITNLVCHSPWGMPIVYRVATTGVGSPNAPIVAERDVCPRPNHAARAMCATTSLAARSGRSVACPVARDRVGSCEIKGGSLCSRSNTSSSRPTGFGCTS